MERGQRHRGSTDCTAATARRPTGRHAELRACRLRSKRIPNRTDKIYRSARTAVTPRRDTHAAAGPPVGGAAAGAGEQTSRSRCTLIPVRILASDLAEKGGKGAVEVGRQVVGGSRSGVGPHDDQRSRRQRAHPLPGQMPQLPLHSITDDRVSDRLGHHETHPRRRHRSGATQMDDERSATGTTSPTHCGSEVTAVAHSVSGGEHPYDRNSAIKRKARRDPYAGGRTEWPGRPGCSYAAESHASWRGVGYSAGTSACSREDSRFVMQVGWLLTSE
jgi:hypothetical protein